MVRFWVGYNQSGILGYRKFLDWQLLEFWRMELRHNIICLIKIWNNQIYLKLLLNLCKEVTSKLIVILFISYIFLTHIRILMVIFWTSNNLSLSLTFKIVHSNAVCKRELSYVHQGFFPEVSVFFFNFKDFWKLNSNFFMLVIIVAYIIM